ncbi:MAG: NHL repeat-containing protein [Actinomycetota bacterium]|jgi:tripartite motif-containing protein 71|nr:NHL repeat-containing protein [Actinomycetota bacterium]
MTQSTVVDEHDNSDEQDFAVEDRTRRTRIALAVILVVLVLLLAAIVTFVVRLSTPAGAPEAESLSDGLTWVRSIYGWGATEDEQLYGPTDVAVGPDGTIWVADSQRFQVVGFAPDGSFRTLVHQGPGVIFPQSFNVSDDNELYLADYAHDRIVVFSPDNVLLREWEAFQPMEVDVRGDRVVVGSRGGVGLYDTGGSLITEWGTFGKGEEQFDVVRGIAIGEDGTVYISDTQNHRIKAYDQEGTLLWVYPSQEDLERFELSEDESNPFQIPTGMTFDAAGRLMVVDPFEFAIIHVDTTTGEEIERWGDFGESDGLFGYPTSIAYDADRDWYVIADTANNRAQIVRIEGSGGGIVAAARRLAVGPIWVCSIPLVLLLVALIMALRSRRSRSNQAVARDEIDDFA